LKRIEIYGLVVVTPSVTARSPIEHNIDIIEEKGKGGNRFTRINKLKLQHYNLQTLLTTIPPYTGFTPHRDHQYGKGMNIHVTGA
jgi:hypothetical protein